jgi:hypothetical protein
VTETANLPPDLAWTAHTDARVAAILRLTQWMVDRHLDAEHYDVTGVVAVIVPHVPEDMARAAVDTIYADAHDATDFDTRGREAVLDRYDRWDDVVGLTADEKASELRDEAWAAARLNAEMLVTLDDNRLRAAARFGG